MSTSRPRRRTPVAGRLSVSPSISGHWSVSRKKMGKPKSETGRISNINSELPPDIVQLILSKLPLFNLPACRLACKTWNNLLLTCKFVPPIQNAFFAHIYPYHSLHCIDFHDKGMSIFASFSFHPDCSNIKIVNFCNGLLCFFNSKRKTLVCILNPMTNEYTKLPRGDSGVNYFYGFGFSPKTKHYKIARHSYIKEKRTTLIEIFAFGTSRGKWTRIDSVPLHIDGHGIYFNGALYWVGRDLHLRGRNVICRLDIEDEKFKEISFPQVGQDRSYGCFTIGVFNGCLYLSIYNFRRFEYHVWTMESHGRGEADSWVRAFVIHIPKNWQMHPLETYHLQFIKACEDRKILCLVSAIHLILYDPKTGTIEILDQNEKYLWVYQIESFTFDSLNKILAGDG